MSSKVVIVGGHGRVALRLAKLISSKYAVTSIIRTADQNADITAVGATPLVLSLYDATVADLASAFTGAEVVVFSAGAGWDQGAEKLRKIDFEAAVKTFDAIEAVSGAKPRLLLVSAADVRNLEKAVPSHYDATDVETSKQIHTMLGEYMKQKYEADKILNSRTAFKWTIVRPGFLNDEAGTGKADIGKTHIHQHISRDDVAQVLALLVERADAAGLSIDAVGGQTPIQEGLDAAIKGRVTAWTE